MPINLVSNSDLICSNFSGVLNAVNESIRREPDHDPQRGGTAFRMEPSVPAVALDDPKRLEASNFRCWQFAGGSIRHRDDATTDRSSPAT
jgi:hypothetical protein